MYRHDVSAKDGAALVLLSKAAVLLLFPGYFLYHMAVSLISLPPFAGGFFAPVAALLGVPLLITQLLRLGRREDRLTRFDLRVLALLAYMVVWASLHFLFGSDAQREPAFYVYGMSSIFYGLVVYVAFRNIDVQGRWFHRALFVSLVAFFVLVVVLGPGSALLLGDPSTVADADADAGAASYQGLSRSVLVVALLALSAANGVRSILFIVSVSLPVLFLLGARSEFVGFCLASAAFIVWRQGAWKTIFVLAPLVALIMVPVAMEFDVLHADSRMLQILDIRDSSSYQARDAFSDIAIASIANHPIVGDYASHLSSGGVGSYAHNALSAWVSYGFVGFAAFVLLLGHALCASLRLARDRGAAHSLAATALIFGIYAAVQAFAAKPVYDPVFSVALGATGGALAGARRWIA